MARVDIMYVGVVMDVGQVDPVVLPLPIDTCIWEGFQRIITIQVHGFTICKMHIDLWIGLEMRWQMLLMKLARLLVE